MATQLQTLLPVAGHAAGRDPCLASLKDDLDGNCEAVNELLEEHIGPVADGIRDAVAAVGLPAA